MCPSERLPFTLCHQLFAPLTPQPSPCRVSLHKRKQKSVQADSFSTPRLFIFCTYAEPQSDLPQGSHRYYQIQLSTLSRTPSPMQEVWHAKCSHCLVDDTQWGRITWRQTNAVLQKISSPVHCHHLLRHSGTLCVSIGWKWPHVLIQPVFPITPPSTPTHWPQLHSKSKMLQTNNMYLCNFACSSIWPKASNIKADH